MKKLSKIPNWIPSIVAGLALAGSTSLLMAQGLELNLVTFDTDITANSALASGAASVTTTEWSAQDSQGLSSSGSEYVTINWPNNGTSWQELQMNFDQSGIDCTKWLNVEYDVKIDQANSFLGPNGNYGFTMPVGQSWDGTHGWVELPSTTLIATNGWQHITANLGSFPAVLNRLVIRLGSNGSQNVTNTVKYWIDNLKLTAPPLPAPTLGKFIAPTPPGLTFIPCTSGQWQRVMVYPNNNALGADFGWYNKGVPVTYSFTITNFPDVNNYAANLFLIPNAHMRDGNAANTSIDWACTNGVFFKITANTNNPATNWYVSLSVKTNAGDANPNFTVVGFDYGQLPIGPWTLRFNNNTEFTIIAPDGFTTNSAFSEEIANLVSGNDLSMLSLTPYFGIMPQTVEHIGAPCVFSRIQIQGVYYPIDDKFSAGILDTTNTWTKLADYPAGIQVITGDLKNYLTWNTPNDQGYQALVVAASITGPWYDLVGNQKWLLVNGTREALIYKSDLHAALGGAETKAAFFALAKRAYTKLQVLMPGETAAPGTASGKTGTPAAQQVGIPFDVTVRAVDGQWYLVNNVNDTVNLTSSDSSAVLPSDTAMAGGTVTLSVTLNATGSFTVTATDLTDSDKTPVTGSAVTVNP